MNFKRYVENKSRNEVIEYILNASVRLGKATLGILYQLRSDNSLQALAFNGLLKEEEDALSTLSVDESEILLSFVKRKARIQGMNHDFSVISSNLGKHIKCFLLQPLLNEKELKCAILLGFSDRSNLTTQELDFYNVFSLLASDIFGLFELSMRYFAKSIISSKKV